MQKRTILIDLKMFGFDARIPLHGQLVEEFHISQGDLIFIFDENHSYLPGIRQSLRNAVSLIDAGIVDLVGVEGMSGDVRKPIEASWKQSGYCSLEEVKQYFRETRIPEIHLVGTAKSFSTALALLRPQVPICGVENAEAYRAAGEEIRRWHRSPSLRCFFSRLPKAERERYIRTRIQGERPRFFIENLSKFREQFSAQKATILNAGRMEQDMVCKLLREKRIFSFLRIRPVPFPEKDVVF